MERKQSRLAPRVHGTRAFTFIEIMVVVVIIGLLVSMGGVMWMKKLEKARIDITKMKIKGELRTELQAHYIANGAYPTSEEGLRSLVDEESGSGEGVEDIITDAWNREFLYACPGREGRSYDLWSMGPDGQDGTNDDIGNWKGPDEEDN